MWHAKKLFIFCLAGAVCCLAAPSYAGDDHGPEAMNLKERFDVHGSKKAVIFPHRLHQQKLDNHCEKCHISPEGGGSLIVEFVKKDGIGNDFHKKFCWDCHVKLNVPKGKACSTCHK